jgi:molybdate transport system substrate-binding protein
MRRGIRGIGWMGWAINAGRELSKRGHNGPQPRGGRDASRLFVCILALVWLMLSLGSTTASGVRHMQGKLTIFAAASLTDVFQEMAAHSEQANPGIRLNFNFAGSPTLRSQLAQGARAEVFAAADEPTMDAAVQDGTISGQPCIFARNLLVVIVPANNPAGINTLQDLSRPRLKLVLANKAVPAGNYARQALEKMGQNPAFGQDFTRRILANLVSEEMNVKQVASKVQLGEADAGIVYATDITPTLRAAMRLLAIPSEFNVIAKYPIAVVQGARNESGARAFIDYVLSPAGQMILERHGFLVAGS